jgi:secondary thiamine-phosphate synthase enzyme
MIQSFRVKTGSRTELINITVSVQNIIHSCGFKNGICQVYIPHTTAGVTINENADPDVKYDIIQTLEKIVPWNNNYGHSEGNSAAHIKASMMGFSVTVPVENAQLALGTWQCIYFCEFDGPRTRTVIVTLIGG